MNIEKDKGDEENVRQYDNGRNFQEIGISGSGEYGRNIDENKRDDDRTDTTTDRIYRETPESNLRTNENGLSNGEQRGQLSEVARPLLRQDITRTLWNGNPKLYKNKWDKLKFKQYFYLKIELEINFLKNYVF